MPKRQQPQLLQITQEPRLLVSWRQQQLPEPRATLFCCCSLLLAGMEEQQRLNPQRHGAEAGHPVGSGQQVG